MSQQVLESGFRTARKEHNCDACQLADCDLDFHFFLASDAEIDIIKKAIAENYKILKGQRYYYQTSVIDGEFHRFKARRDIHNLFIERKVYSEISDY